MGGSTVAVSATSGEVAPTSAYVLAISVASFTCPRAIKGTSPGTGARGGATSGGASGRGGTAIRSGAPGLTSATRGANTASGGPRTRIARWGAVSGSATPAGRRPGAGSFITVGRARGRARLATPAAGPTSASGAATRVTPVFFSGPLTR